MSDKLSIDVDYTTSDSTSDYVTISDISIASGTGWTYTPTVATSGLSFVFSSSQISSPFITGNFWNDKKVNPDVDYEVDITLQDGSQFTIPYKDYWKFVGFHGHKPEDCKDYKEYNRKMTAVVI
jgi:hypothetical protein